MRLWQNRFTQTSLSLLFLAGLLTWGIWRNGLPTAIDGQLHFYRLLELHWAVQNGQFYPRWLPDMVFGFGAPVFNFYPPLTYWVAEIFVLLGANAVLALKISYSLAILLLVGSAYALGKALWQAQPAAWALTLAYSFAPYVYFNMLQRGAYPELWGMALLPMLLNRIYAYLHATTQPNARLLEVALCAAALVYAHSLSALMAIPLVGVLSLVWAGWDWRKWVGLCSAGLLTVGLTAAWWAPFVRESQFVQLQRATQLAFVVYSNNWNTLASLFHPPLQFDPSQMGQEIPVSLNWGALALAGLAMWRGQARGQVAIWLGLAVGYLLLQLPISQAVWQSVPGLSYLQFPWRLTGPLSLLLALLASAGWQSLAKKNEWTVAGLALLLWACGLGWSFSPANLSLAGQTHRDIPAYEIRTGQTASTTTGEFVNIWAEQLPDSQALAAHYQQDNLPFSRLSHRQLPADVEILAESAGWESTTFQYRAQLAWTAELDWLLFPEMQVLLDGKPFALEIVGGKGTGRIPHLPAGEHTVAVTRQPSAVQRVGGWLSFGALCVALAGWGWHMRPSATRQKPPPSQQLTRFSSLPLLAGFSLAMLLRLFWLDTGQSPWRYAHLSAEGLAGVQHPLQMNFGNELQLLGWSAEGADVTLYWQALRPLQTRYSVGLYVHNAEGTRLSQHDRQHAANLPTSEWQLGMYALGVHHFENWQALPAGTYTLYMSVYSEQGNLDYILPDGTLNGTFVALGEIKK
ncbi:MAG TPA: hypothetical protein PK299_14610 [Anaerolineales bacterium]|nr:hypothetical protein [Anaerolineales bacterium]